MGGDVDPGAGDEGEDEQWRDYFGFAEPYPNQVDAIRSAIAVGREQGYLAMEGPCGTGKTMAALTAAAYLTRHTDAYDNVFVATPVKQQLQQFVADLRQVNASIQPPFRGVALVGKADLCPYEREGVFPPDVGVNARCRELRESTAELIETEHTQSGTTSRASDAPGESAIAGVDAPEEVWWSVEKAGQLVTNARHEGTARSDESRLRTNGVDSPYHRQQPSAPEEFSAGGDTPSLYCPFEADWYARNKGSPVGFDAGGNSVLTLDEYLPTAVANGTCPHRVMGVLLEAADIVIGNYNHIFDPQTRPLTESVLTDRTFVIIDEAHRLEDRVRDLLSDTIGRHTIRRARGDLRFLTRYSDESLDHREYVTAKLNEYDVTPEDVSRAIEFYTDLLEWLADRITTYFDTANVDIDAITTDPDEEIEDIEIPLRNPQDDHVDELTTWATEHGYSKPFVSRLSTIGQAVEQTLRLIEPDRSCVCTATGALMGAWVERSHATYFREIHLRSAPTNPSNPDAEWERAFAPRLVMYNCMPGDRLAEIFDDLGGGILMSATLEPIDVFKEVTGLTAIAEAANPERPVEARTFELPFPPENRASWIVDSTPFTASNRGPPDPDNSNDVREEYRRILRDIAQSPGNVMVCLPNYREARWAGRLLQTELDKPVIIDESSSVAVTNELKSRFISGSGKVLVTSTRGTLTEGIDYDGDKLHTCAVIGIPLVNIGSPRVQAVKHAYAAAFGDDHAFEYALAIPAVRRARQALGRVIRGPDERGVRIFVDNRYTAQAHYGSVFQYLPENERREFVRMTPMFLASQINDFWPNE